MRKINVQLKIKIMANYASNIVYLTFNEEKTVEEKDSILMEFDKQFKINNYPEDLEQCSHQIEFESKWTAPLEYLQEFSNKNNISVKGVAFEFENDYMEVFEY